jgi:hypothetical protein
MGFWEMLTKGEGTPWGAMESGKPDAPQNLMAGVNQDPNAYSGFDRSGLKSAMMRNLQKQGMRTQGQARAGLQRAGIQGADTSRALVDLAAQQEEGGNAIEADIAMKEWQDKVGERDRAMQAAQAQQNYLMQRYAADQAQYGQENASRGGFWNSLLSAAGAGLGGYLGGRK